MEQAAEQALLPRFRNLAEHEREEKTAGEVVTVADRECEAMLSEALARLLPGASIVGEEAAEARPELLDRLGDERCWIVDPLDGTGYFAAGHEPFGIMVALASGGLPVGGWILDPLSQRFCWTASGQGAWIDERRIAARPSVASPRAIGLSPLLRSRPQRFAAVVGRLETHFDPCDLPRCAAFNYPAMLLSSPDLTLYERTLPWDHAPGVLLIEEAGGRVARLDGSPYRVDDDRTGLLAATDLALWDEAAALLQDLPA
jgi:fructose-1,6-bisphosphatase/inositol monophosphatase family enzyme